jgi:hypothetical protein
LAGDERVIVERWLGRALSADETISVSAYRPHPAPVGDEREALRRNIITQAREIGSHAPDVTGQELDALLDEAFTETRGKRG